MASMFVTGDRYLEKLVKFVEQNADTLIEDSTVLKLNPAGLHYVHSRLEALRELELLLTGAPVDYLRAYVSDLGDHRALEQLRRILCLLSSLKVFSVLSPPLRDPTPLSLMPFGRLKVLELRGCDLSTSAAKGLLELRHTLEKIICHNSTDALRHLFASRIVEIRDSPQWTRLWFVSCPCNYLVLMDESLLLLPAVDTLDLSRNRFAKLDNLRKCTNLKHLDLGFNQLRTIAPFSEVSCHIVKLVLRNNAITTLRGIENLRALEALDISYNIVSNFSELEFLAGLSSLNNLWFEGNPLCCARWYRALTFSYFTHPDRLKLDEKEMSNREFWEMQIIVARRNKRPASFGYYSFVRDEPDGERNSNIKKRKVSRLALIVSDEESTHVSSDQDSASCEIENQNKEENAVSDNEAEIDDLMHQVELMKKERSIFWLREFTEWMDHSPKNSVEKSDMTNKMVQKHENSKCVSESFQASEDESSTNVIESESSFADNSVGHGGVSLSSLRKMDSGLEHDTYQSVEGLDNVYMQSKSSIHGGSYSMSPLSAINDAIESHSSSAVPGSPPHYQEDILLRRNNLVEEILQLSAESYFVASSDSYTSSDEDNLFEFEQLTPEVDHSPSEEYYYNSVRRKISSTFQEDNHNDQITGIHYGKNGTFLLASSNECRPSTSQLENQKADSPAESSHGEIAYFYKKEVNCLEKLKTRRLRKVSLQEDDIDNKSKSSRNDNNYTHRRSEQSEIENRNPLQHIDARLACKKERRTSVVDHAERSSLAKCSCPSIDDFVEKYFNANVADSRNHEICMLSLHCNCIFRSESLHPEREVVILLSSENKLYVILTGAASDQSGSVPQVMGCHKIEDVREVLIGVGLQVVRVDIDRGAAYLFLTRCMEKSRQLLCILQVLDTDATNGRYILRSLEQVQVELFVRQICGGSKMSIFQYSMVLLSRNNFEDTSWLSRSLFVAGGYVLVCIEDLSRFGSLMDGASSRPYFLLDSCFSIAAVSEMVIETKNCNCVTLTLQHTSTNFCSPVKVKEEATFNKDTAVASSSLTWKLVWFSEESVLNFVSLIKAIHAGMTTSTLLIRRDS